MKQSTYKTIGREKAWGRLAFGLALCLLMAGCAPQQAPAAQSEAQQLPVAESEATTPHALPQKDKDPESETVDGEAMIQRVSAVFPAYQDGRDENNGTYYDCAPFSVSFLLPEGWSVQLPQESDRNFDQAMNTPMLLCDGEGNAVGRMGYGLIGQIEPDQQPEAAEYYKLVYSYLRTPSSCYWEDYRVVKRTATGENAVATVYFADPQPGQDAAAAEERTALGAMAYDRELGVYVAVQMDENAPLTADQVDTLAQSITLVVA